VDDDVGAHGVGCAEPAVGEQPGGEGSQGVVLALPGRSLVVGCGDADLGAERGLQHLGDDRGQFAVRDDPAGGGGQGEGEVVVVVAVGGVGGVGVGA
jgi:hypothetical protein